MKTFRRIGLPIILFATSVGALLMGLLLYLDLSLAGGLGPIEALWFLTPFGLLILAGCTAIAGYRFFLPKWKWVRHLPLLYVIPVCLLSAYALYRSTILSHWHFFGDKRDYVGITHESSKRARAGWVSI